MGVKEGLQMLTGLIGEYFSSMFRMGVYRPRRCKHLEYNHSCEHCFCRARRIFRNAEDWKEWLAFRGIYM